MDVLDSLVAENVRLKSELTAARQRIRALEASRWYRLNPRRWLPRREPVARIPDTTKPLIGTSADAAAADQFESFRIEVASRGTFTEDWFVRGQPVHSWEPLLRGLEGRRARILEIGSYEGMSACFLLWRLADATITCVDTFAGGIDHRGREAVGELEERFDANVALVDASRVRKLVGESRRVLPNLIAADEAFDLVYVDGSHLGLDVLVDASLSWQVLGPGGVLVFDDYNWSPLGDDALLRPGPAIDAFLEVVSGKYAPVFADRQVAIRKLAPDQRALAGAPRVANQAPAARRRNAGAAGTE